MHRTLYEAIWNKLSPFRQMVFIAGPRQTGKTTFSKMLAAEFTNSLYFNWDIIENKKQLIENPYFYEEVYRKDNSKPLVIFDELHKYEQWKNYLKGVYDRDKDNYKFIVSGSGRLDIRQKGGDSLAGRYLLFYLWPFTLAELAGKNRPFNEFMTNPQLPGQASIETLNIWENLSVCSGFPDPYLNADKDFYRLWTTTYKKQLLREDIASMVTLRKSDTIEILFSLLHSKIGNPLSIASLSRDLQVSFDTIKQWLELFERFFMIFQISPWSQKISRALTKEKKLYLYDYGCIENEPQKYENMVALELWRAIANWNDSGLGTFSLHYVRNREKEEVDFLVVRNNKPFLLIEAKFSDSTAGKPLKKFQNIMTIPAIQLINKKDVCKLVSNESQKILIISAHRWLSLLP